MDWKRFRHALAVAAVPLLDSGPRMPRRDLRRWPTYKVPHGKKFVVDSVGDYVLYRELQARCAFATLRSGDDLRVQVPPPDLWDANVPPFLRGRRAEVAARLEAESYYRVVVGSDALYTDPVEPKTRAVWSQRQRPAKPLYKGDGFTVVSSEKEQVVYTEAGVSLPFWTNWEACPRTVIMPRPEEWQFVAPEQLLDRYDIIRDRLQAHSLHEVVTPEESQQAGAHRILSYSTEDDRAHCTTCDMNDVAIPTENRNGALEIDAQETERAILERVADGRFEVIRADVAIDRSLDALDREVLWTVTSFFWCTVSDETIAWHLSIHDSPTYMHVKPALPFMWPWTPGHPQVDNRPEGVTFD